MHIEPLGDRAVLIRFGDTIDERVHARVMRAARLLSRHPFTGMGELVPAYGALAVYYDVVSGAGAGAGTANGGLGEAGGNGGSDEAGRNGGLGDTGGNGGLGDAGRNGGLGDAEGGSGGWGAPLDSISGETRGSSMADGDEVSSRYAGIVSHLTRVLESVSVEADELHAPARIVEIPVCYGGEYGPDIGDVAARAGLGEGAVAARHAAASYRVAMLGFSPGFPFLLGLPPELACPRRDTPRASVPAGSVGIAGAQTGVYPLESPGGWRIIGRTPLALFDVLREPPALLQPGDRVRFVAISSDEFERMRG